jgi:hypothetical protein
VPAIVLPYPENQAKRFDELAELFLLCRAAWREVTAETEGHPNHRSVAASDQREIAEQIAPKQPHAPLMVLSAVQQYMLAASEQFGGLAALYQAEEVLYSPSSVARSALEQCACAAWVVDGDSAENRLARAYREHLKSAEEAKMNSGRLLGKEDPTHQQMAEAFSELSKEIEEVFPDGWSTNDEGQRLLHGQSKPGLEESVAWLLSEFLSRGQSRDVGRGSYGYISNMTHPTLYRISGLWAVEEQNGKRTAVLDVRVEDHEKQAKLIVCPYYEVLARMIEYHGWPGIQHHKLTEAIDRLLPGTLKASGE